MSNTTGPATSPRIRALASRLDALTMPLTPERIEAALHESGIGIDDVREFIAPTKVGYGRRRVLRTDAYEALVMTWLPGQRTGPHDHGGAASVFKILQGTARELRFAAACDSLVEPVRNVTLSPGEVGHDNSGVIHEVINDASQPTPLVSLHVYAPPLPELRRYCARAERSALHPAFVGPSPTSTRGPADERVVAIIGGGFSGSMVAAQLARQSTASSPRLRLIMIDRQTTLAEGAAYRTPDPIHVLNVAAQNMGAWADNPRDFLDWCRQRDPQISPLSYAPRRLYGEYLRSTLFSAVDQCRGRLSVEYHRLEAQGIRRDAQHRWTITLEDGQTVSADTLVLATGHRPPDDPLAGLWRGSRARYVQDPWAALALASVEPHESVCLLGSALTAVDVLLTLSKQPRTGSVVALSRRGLAPAGHASPPAAPLAPTWLEASATGPLAIRALVRDIREDIAAAGRSGADWRAVIDGLRSHTTRIWQRLPNPERRRFLRHVRAYWEIARHRMAPEVAAHVDALRTAGIFRVQPGRLLAAEGSADGVTLCIQPRGSEQARSERYDWIINCTGPGSVATHRLPRAIHDLVRDGWLERDALELGVRSAPDGRAVVEGCPIDDLYLIGSLRKPDLWESTAVPELRGQAAAVAQGILSRPAL